MRTRSISTLLVIAAWLPLRVGAQNNGVVYQIPTTEYNALGDLYTNTAGANWSNHSGWIDPNATSWYGVTISGVVYDGSGNVLVRGHVVSLTLGNNRLIGTIPDSIGNLTQLHSLYLSVNSLTGSIPDTLENLSPLQQLYLDHNQLTGSIPTGLGNLSSLQNLYLDENQLTGSIPDTLGNLSQLQNLNLLHNALTGSIPSALGNLSQLITLALDDNPLTGSIPDELGNLSQLQSLSLSGNQLSGSIPTALGNLSHLGQLDLQDDLLSGDVPDFAAFTNVTLTIDGNYLNIAAGSLSLSNINAMIAAGNTVSYMPQNKPALGISPSSTNRLGFTIAGLPGLAISVRASTNLASTNWTTVQSCSLTNGSMYFSDPQGGTYPSRFYRITSP